MAEIENKEPKAKAPKVEAPKVEAPKVEAPKVEAPKVEAPKVDKERSKYVRPEYPKPKGWFEVLSVNVGTDLKKRGKIFITYVSPEIGKLYKEKLAAGTAKNILEVRE